MHPLETAAMYKIHSQGLVLSRRYLRSNEENKKNNKLESIHFKATPLIFTKAAFHVLAGLLHVALHLISLPPVQPSMLWSIP